MLYSTLFASLAAVAAASIDIPAVDLIAYPEPIELAVYPAEVTPRAESSKTRSVILGPGPVMELTAYEPIIEEEGTLSTPRAVSGKARRIAAIDPNLSISEMLAYNPDISPETLILTTPRAVSDKERRQEIGSPISISEMLVYLPETIPDEVLSTPRAVSENEKRINIGDISEMLAYTPELPIETPIIAEKSRRNLTPKPFKA